MHNLLEIIENKLNDRYLGNDRLIEKELKYVRRSLNTLSSIIERVGLKLEIKPITCHGCGSDDIVKMSDGHFVCLNCLDKWRNL